MKKWNFLPFFALQRPQKVSLYTSPDFKSCQIPRGRSLQNIMTIALEFARKFGKKLPPQSAGFGIRFFNYQKLKFWIFWQFLAHFLLINSTQKNEKFDLSGFLSLKYLLVVGKPYGYHYYSLRRPPLFPAKREIFLPFISESPGRKKTPLNYPKKISKGGLLSE